MLARLAKRRLERFATGAYDEAGLIVELTKCSVQWVQQPAVARAPITDEEVAKLNLELQCKGCGRPAACMASLQGHEQHCGYVKRVETWTNPQRDDGYWDVTALTDVRGPPENRYWKLVWAGGRTDGHGGADTGTFASDWQPGRNVARCTELQKQFWLRNPALWEKANESIEALRDDGSLIHRCTHCNRMGFNGTAAYRAHVTTCKFKPAKWAHTSKVGGLVQDARQQAAQAAWPTVTVHTAEGAKELDAKLHEKYLGHLTSADGRTTTDMRSRMRSSTTGFNRAMHLWKHTRVRRRDKFRMLRRYVMKLVYAGADTWLLDKPARRALNNWAARKTRTLTGRTVHEECRRRTVDIVAMLRHWRRRWTHYLYPLC